MQVTQLFGPWECCLSWCRRHLGCLLLKCSVTWCQAAAETKWDALLLPGLHMAESNSILPFLHLPASSVCELMP